MDLLAAQFAALGPTGDLPLSAALAELSRREKYLALEIAGVRYNIGVKYGILAAQLALAMAGKDREEVLAQLVELLAVKS
jgi:UTP--glucose-1-phosphate uridylyltransferase